MRRESLTWDAKAQIMTQILSWAAGRRSEAGSSASYDSCADATLLASVEAAGVA